MERWIPNFYLQEGREKGYSEEYLQSLLDVGRVVGRNNLPVVYTLSHLANTSRTLYSDLHAFVARSENHSADETYRSFTIKKRSGGDRWISIPCPPLMAVQSWIAQEILRGIPTHPAAMAYVSGLKNPLKVHARKHLGARWILKVDIKNFFNNISEQQVYKIFKGAGYPELLSFEMARLCTRITPRRRGKRWNKGSDTRYLNQYANSLIGSLPQGAPTSPAASNIVCLAMDEEFEALAVDFGATYSRYADDLCFSFFDSDRAAITSFRKLVVKILWGHKFEENSSKTRIIPPGRRKIITGIVIDSGKTTVPKELRDRIRMHLYYAGKYGIPSHCKRKSFRSVIGFRNHLSGLIAYVSSINPNQGSVLHAEYSKLPWLEFDI